ncbi:Zinc finger MYM-type protein [Trichinella spiralis]|uniref:Zinc finger MYM-type protein n=1 Tax=Trichinella spiralis TaxID=6334 RepID=A0ABR3KCW6_TRISP
MCEDMLGKNLALIMDSRVRWNSMLTNIAKVFGDEGLRQKCFEKFVRQQRSDIAKKLFNAMKNRTEERRNASLCGLLCYLDNPSSYVSSSSSNCILTRPNKRDIKATAKDLFDRLFKIQRKSDPDISKNDGNNG